MASVVSVVSRPGRAAVALLLTMPLAGCGLWGPEGGPGGAGIAAPVQPSAEVEADTTQGPDGVQRAEITIGDDLRLHPALVHARLGVIELTVRNVGATPHDLAIATAPSPADTGNINGGRSATVRITIDAAGRYAVTCLYHASSGMTGAIDVSAAEPP